MKLSGKQFIAMGMALVGVLFVVLGIIGFAGTGKQDPYETRNGIVMVYEAVYDDQGGSLAGWGTGWAIGKPGEPVEYIVTNGHVVAEAYTYPRQYSNITGEIMVYFSAAENDYVIPEVVYYSAAEEKDIAILRLPTATDKREALIIRDSDEVSIGDTAWALGYPGVSAQSQQYTTFDQNDITLTKGIISKRTKPVWGSYDAFQMDVYINHGNSGGPLVDKNGYVIGVNSSGAVDDEGKSEGVNYAITSRELMKILDNEGIEYTSSGGLKWMGYVFLPLGILAILSGAAVFIMEARSGGAYGKKTAASGAGGTIPAAGGEPGAGARPAQKKAVLRGITGKYAGQSFPFDGGKLVIGRDPAVCNIIYDKDTPGISGRHCRVIYDGNEECFLLNDLGSSYGKFLGNGKKLTANVTEKLAPGDGFYLCDTSNRFVVTRE